MSRPKRTCTVLGIKYQSIKEASIASGLHPTTILRCAEEGQAGFFVGPSAVEYTNTRKVAAGALASGSLDRKGYRTVLFVDYVALLKASS
jgi:hypothetical protein